MRQSDALKLARDTLREHGLPHWKVVIDKRPTRRMGQCRYAQCTIGISAITFTTLTDEGIVDTIMHEVAHAIVGGGHGHDAVWRRAARMLGANPRSKASAAQVRPDYVPNLAWTGTCNNCGKEFGRQRLTQATRERGRCPNDRGTLTWRKNR